MRTEFEIFITPSLITGAALFALFAIRAVLLRFLHRERPGVSAHKREAIVNTFRLPTLFWALAGSILVGLETFPLPERAASELHTLIQVLLIISITVVISNFTILLVRDFLQRAGSPMTGSGLVFGVIRTAVFLVGALIALSKMGISIAPLITALGVGGLAVGLAFKDTLENLFSGIHVLIDGQIQVGDLIQLETDQEGIVEDIGWRTSKLILRGEDTLIVPNTRLAQGIVRRKKQPTLPSASSSV